MVEDLRAHFEKVAAIRDDVLSRTEARPVSEKEFPDDVAQLNELVDQVNLSDAYRAMEDRIAEDLKEAIAAMPGLEDTAINWLNLSTGEKTSFLERVLAVQASLQSAASGIEVRSAPVTWFTDRILAGGAFAKIRDRNGEQDEIMLERGEIGRGALSRALDTVTHEQTHVFQSWLGRAVADGRIDSSHPLHDDGLKYWIKEQTGSYIGANKIMSPYKRQMEEVDAERVGKDVRRFMEGIEAKLPLASARKDNMGPLLVFGLAAAGLMILAGGGGRPRPHPIPVPG